MATNYTQIEASDWQGLLDRLTESETRLAAIESQHDGLVERVTAEQAAQEAKLSSLEKERVAHAAKLTAIEAAQSAIKVKVDDYVQWKPSANATMNRNEDLIEGMQPQVDALDARLDKAEPVLIQLDARLKVIEPKVLANTQADTGLDARLDVLEPWRSVIDKTVAEYAARLAALEKPVPKEPPQDAP